MLPVSMDMPVHQKGFDVLSTGLTGAFYGTHV